MKKYLFGTFLALFFLMVGVSGPTTAEAQIGTGDCGSCRAWMSPLSSFNFGCNTRIFAVNRGLTYPCQGGQVVWTTNCPGATIVNAGGQAKITFPVNGTWTVTATWYYTAGGGIVEGCQISSSTSVTINC